MAAARSLFFTRRRMKSSIVSSGLVRSDPIKVIFAKTFAPRQLQSRGEEIRIARRRKD
jgi:hypothetical protein